MEDFKKIKLIVYDFDGVMTDNRVWVDEDGKEAVMVNRSDGLAVDRIRRLGIRQIIISTEKNNVVERRAEKLGIEVIHDVEDKRTALKTYADSIGICLEQIMFIGNDINDLEALRIVGIAGAPKDAENEILEIAHWISSANGGCGVVRDLYRAITEDEIKC